MEAAENKENEEAPDAEEAAVEAAAETPAESKPQPAASPGGTGLKGTRALRKLRDHVERAANELVRLREENDALQERIATLESTPASHGGDEAGLLLLDTDPEALKRKVEGFIQSIDNYLDNKDPLE
ncbi:MAG: hypothetical protein AAF564_13825 [Bacteroidota bacterium]